MESSNKIVRFIKKGNVGPDVKKKLEEPESCSNGPNTTREGESNDLSCIITKLENVHLDITSVASSEDPTCLAGHLASVILDSRTALVQVAVDRPLLQCGTVLFVQINNGRSENTYVEIGRVYDIFGNVNKPMYAVEIDKTIKIDQLRVGQMIFCVTNHPSTEMFSIQFDRNSGVTIVEG